MFSRIAALFGVAVALASQLLAQTAPAQAPAGCGGCPQLAACGSAKVEESHCHWLEVSGVVPGGAAEAVGVRPGSRLESYGGMTVGCLKDFNAAKDAAKSESVEVVFTSPTSMVRLTMMKGKSMGVYLKEWQNDTTFGADAKVVEGVPALGWQTMRTNSFVAALAAVVMQQEGRECYDELMGASGAAFRLQFREDWCPSAVDASVGYNAAEEAARLRGYRLEWLMPSSDGKNRPQILAAIRSSIDAGMPVLACDLREQPEWGVITGYQQGGAELIGRTCFDKRKGYDVAEKFPMVVAVLVKQGTAPDEATAVRQGFATVAVNLATAKYGEYWSGLAAFDRWVERLRTDDFTGLGSARFSDVVQANYWTYQRLIDDRKAGIEYLGKVAELLPQYKPSVDELVVLYGSEVALLEPLLEELPSPGSVIWAEQWTVELREEQAAALKAARVAEEKALAVWQKLALAEK